MNQATLNRMARQAEAEESLARAAHLYYVLGMTQAEVAERLHITRFKVNRMLAQARQKGMVRIAINVPYRARLDLEQQLVERFGLVSAVVCPAEATDETSLSEVIGQYAAGHVAGLLEDGMVIAVSWGKTLRALGAAIIPDAARDLCVTSMLGALTSQSDLGRFGAADALAKSVGAECLFIPGPILCDCVATKDAINAQPAAQLAIERSKSADIALLSVGGLGMSSLREASSLSDEDYQSAVNAGAIGNFLGRFIGADGHLIAHDLNDRATGVHPDEIASIPLRLLCAGGEHKTEGIRVILEKGYGNAIITDEDTAQRLLRPATG